MKASNLALCLLTATGLLIMPSAARADLKESWETGVDAARWKASWTQNTYATAGATPIVTKSSIADEGPTAPCAGQYLRETDGLTGGRVFAVGTGVQAVVPGNTYCVSAWTRAATNGRPAVGIVYTGATGLPDPSSSTDTECWLLATDSYGGPGCDAASNVPASVPVNGRWNWTAQTFKVPAGRAYAQLKITNFCGDGACRASNQPPADFDDVRLTPGACPTLPPTDTAPHAVCAGTTPICVPGDATTNARCLDCNGDFGQAAATRACPTAEAPVCVTTGLEKGLCRPSCTDAASCTAQAPFCVPIAGSPYKECKPCAASAGASGDRVCAAENPQCFTTGPKTGTCGKCTVRTDCEGATPACNLTTGRCTDDCKADIDCGTLTSGKICQANKCIDGCRGDQRLGNGCPAGKVCSSPDGTPGTCGSTGPQPDAGPDSAAPDASPSPTPVPTEDAGTVVPTPEPTPETPATEEAGGCAATPSTSFGGATAALLGLTALTAVLRRRRR